MAFHYSPKIVTDGLVLVLDAANSKSYSGSGTTWSDLSGNGNNGTLVNSPTFSTDKLGSLVFDGSNDYAELDNVFEVESLSIEFYVKPLTIPGGTDTGRILSRDRSDYWMVGRANSSYSVPNALEWTVYPGGSSMKKRYTSTAFFTDNEWVHGVVTYNGNNGVRNVYKNGTLFETISNAGATSGNIGNGSTRIIAVNNNVESSGAQGNLGLEGYYALIRAYSIPLTDVQVQQNYNALKSRFGL